MFLGNVLRRWNDRPVVAAARAEAIACRVTPSLLEELAADSADFADLAQVLGVDLGTVIETLVVTRPSTPDGLVDRLRERTAAARPAVAAAHEPAPAGASDDPLRRMRARCTGVADRLARLARGEARAGTAMGPNANAAPSVPAPMTAP